jgi:hypothetical protein
MNVFLSGNPACQCGTVRYRSRADAEEFRPKRSISLSGCMLLPYIRSAAFRGDLVPIRNSSRMSESLLESRFRFDLGCRFAETIGKVRRNMVTL